MCGCTAGGKVSYTHHANLMQQLFDDLGVDTTKLTHELRIFAAQLLYEMGVSLEVRGSCSIMSGFCNIMLGSIRCWHLERRCMLYAVTIIHLSCAAFRHRKATTQHLTAHCGTMRSCK